MEDAFNKLMKDGKNDTNNIVKWMKESKIIGEEKKEEDKVTEMLNSVSDKGKVTLVKFQEVLGKIAAEKKVDVNSLLSNVQSGAQSVVNNLTSAFK